MKKIFFSSIIIILLLNANSVSAQVQEKLGFPYGCRTWTIGINVGFFSMTTEVDLCCIPNASRNPPIQCIEVRSSPTGNVYQYIMIDDIEAKIKHKVEGSTIEISSNTPIIEDGKKYQLKKDNYPIESNDIKQRFVKVLFEKV